MPQRKIVIPKEKLSSKEEDKHDDSAGSQESKQTVVAGPAEEQAGPGTVSASLLDKHSKPEANAGPKNIGKNYSIHSEGENVAKEESFSKKT